MAHKREDFGLVAAAGGLVAVASDEGGAPTPVQLYDEASGRWLALPHSMAEPRVTAHLVSAPPAALVAAAQP